MKSSSPMSFSIAISALEKDVRRSESRSLLSFLTPTSALSECKTCAKVKRLITGSLRSWGRSTLSEIHGNS
jgi:hypothetical protein